jgi:3-hydroxymyristoyl/3-hydroxydecanoyl-(acyl carrier protein) dehydratase
VNCTPIVKAIAREAGQVSLQLDLPADLPCFQGHFPGFPVLPGVIQLDWVMRLAVEHLRCGQLSATDFRIKFRQVVGPGSPLTLTLTHDAPRQRLDFTYHIGDLVASQGRVMLDAP